MDAKKLVENFKKGLMQAGQLTIGIGEQALNALGTVAGETYNVIEDGLEVIGAKPAPSATEQAEEVLQNMGESQNSTNNNAATGGENAPIIQDTTNNNVETSIGGNWQDWAKEMQERQWQREDEIRAETQAREDSAWQRAVADMQKAGVNPNLVNASPAASGGGITSATGIDYTVYEKEMEKEIALLEQFIDNEFNASENQKDRLTNLIGRILSMGGLIGAAHARK